MDGILFQPSSAVRKQCCRPGSLAATREQEQKYNETPQLLSSYLHRCSACCHLITLSARASTSAGSPYDFRFEILDFGLFGHRMTRSALANTFGGIVNPICLAVFKLMISSNLVGCSTGKSAGFAPLRILSTYVAERRNKSVKLTL